MRVICIKDNGNYHPGVPKVFVGKPYTVIETVTSGFDNKVRYCFAECGYDNLYLSSHFAESSDIDETTFERDYNKELQPK